MVRRWMLHHEVGVNSAAKPVGHRQLVCVNEFAFLDEVARVAKAARASCHDASVADVPNVTL